MGATIRRRVTILACPTCGRGSLHPSDGKLHKQRRGNCVEAIKNSKGVETFSSRFTAVLGCSHAPECAEIVTVCGNLIEPDVFFPLAINPPLLPITLPSQTPTFVLDAIRSASMIYWSNPSSAANMIRRATEGLMYDQLGLELPQSGTLADSLNLHQLIEKFEKRDPINANLLMAVKWIGNDASHLTGINRDQVLDAFDIFELVVENLYNPRRRQSIERANQLNADRRVKTNSAS